MANSYTTNYGLIKPTDGSTDYTESFRTNFDTTDTIVKAVNDRVDNVLALGTGPAGPPTTFLGPWVYGTSYAVGQAVSYNGSSYVCISATTEGTTDPATDTSHFDLLALKGSAGSSSFSTLDVATTQGIDGLGMAELSLNFTNAVGTPIQFFVSHQSDGLLLICSVGAEVVTFLANAGNVNGSGSNYDLKPGYFYIWRFNVARNNWDLLIAYSSSILASAPIANHVTGGNTIMRTNGVQYYSLYSGGFIADISPTGQLGANPIDGQTIIISNTDGTAVQFQRYSSGHTINGKNADFTLSAIGQVAVFVYEASATNWRLVSFYDPTTVGVNYGMTQIITPGNFTVADTPAPQLIRFVGATAGQVVQLAASPVGAQVVYLKNESNVTLDVYGHDTTVITGPPEFINAFQHFILPVDTLNLGIIWKLIYDSTNNVWKLLSQESDTLLYQYDGSLISPSFATGEYVNRLLDMDRTQNGEPESSFIVPYSTYHYVAFGDSITAGVGASSEATCWAQLTANALQVASFSNQGIGGDLSMDMTNRIFNYSNPSISQNNLFTVAIGRNDCSTKPLGTLQNALFNSCVQGSIAWLGCPAENKVAGNLGTLSGFTADTTYTANTGATSTTNGSTAVYNLTTYGGPIYLWYKSYDATPGGVFTYSIDAGTAVSVACNPGVPIATQNGSVTAVQYIRIPYIAEGSHVITITVTSATGSSNVVTIMGVGTPAAHSYYTAPRVLVGGILPLAYNENAQIESAYTQMVCDAIALLARDGLDVWACNNRKPMKNGSDVTLYFDGQLHPNDAGYALIAPTWIAAAKVPPGKHVRRRTPPAGSKGTPGDVWCDSTNVYTVASNQTIHYQALPSGTI